MKDIKLTIKQAEEIKETLQQQKQELFKPSTIKLKPCTKEQFANIEETLWTISNLKSKLQTVRHNIQNPHKELAKEHISSALPMQ